MNKRGMTLMELIVYMAIVGIVVVIAGTAFTSSTKMRIRTESKLDASQLAENAGMLFREDVAQMGAKSVGGSGNSFQEISEVQMPATSGTDNSSFVYAKNYFGDGLDSLAFRRVKYKEDGTFLRVEEISWFASDDGVLYRSCKTITSASATSVADTECPATKPLVVTIAENVERFTVTPAKPGVLQSDYNISAAPLAAAKYPTLLPSNTDASVQDFRLISRYGEDGYAFVTVNPANGGNSVSISGFASNYDFDEQEIKTSDIVANQVYVAPANNAVGTWNERCSKIDELSVGVEYELSFNIPFASSNKTKTFCPGRDHMAVGFRTKSNGAKVDGVEDFLFYPPAVENGSTLRSFRFSPSKTVKNVCLAFTFVIYSPQANSGYVTISSLKLKRVDSSNYEFVDGYEPLMADKPNVKAFRLQLKVLKNSEAGEVNIVVPTPSNGNKD